MRRQFASWIGMLLASAVSLPAAAAQSAVPPVQSSPYRAVLDRYCVSCHNEKLKTADLTLDKIDAGNVSGAAPVWEKVIRKLRTGAMPPAEIGRAHV